MTLIKVKQPVANSYYYNGWMDHLLNDLTRSFEKTSPAESVKPQVNITEAQDSYKLELSAPGRLKEDFKINIDKNLLTVSYEKNQDAKDGEPKVEDIKYIKREFSIQPFQRSFTLDEKIDVDNVKVKYENGMLAFHLPKKAQLSPSNKSITVE